MFSKSIIYVSFFILFTSYLIFILAQGKVSIFPDCILLTTGLGIFLTIQYLHTQKTIKKLKEEKENHETYVAGIIHDLKNPLIGQIRILEMIIKNSYTGNIQNILKQILSSNKLSLEMVMSILNTYKYAEGKINYAFQECDLANLTTEACKELTRFTPEENDIHLNIKTDKETVYADKTHLRRVIVNLLSNAIRYRKEDTPIFVEVDSEGDDYRFSVTNRGYHIKPELQNKLFEKYMNKSSTFNKISTGLGLYLSKKIINDHKGEMLVSSTKDGTNTFGFTIPKE